MFHFGATLERDEGAKLELADGTFGWDFGEMRRAKYLAGTDATPIGDGMSTEVAEVLRGETAEQLEVDHDPRLLSLFGDVFGNVSCLLAKLIGPAA